MFVCELGGGGESCPNITGRTLAEGAEGDMWT
jgi:hypothetical protein